MGVNVSETVNAMSDKLYYQCLYALRWTKYTLYISMPVCLCCRYNIRNHTWSRITTNSSTHPPERHGHTLTADSDTKKVCMHTHVYQSGPRYIERAQICSLSCAGWCSLVVKIMDGSSRLVKQNMSS